DLAGVRLEDLVDRALDRDGVREDLPDLAPGAPLDVVEEQDVERIADRERQDVPVLREREDRVLLARLLGQELERVRIRAHPRQVDGGDPGGDAERLEELVLVEDARGEEGLEDAPPLVARAVPVRLADELGVEEQPLDLPRYAHAQAARMRVRSSE